MKASKGGHTAIVELLLGAGADTDAKNKVRVTKRKKSTHAHTHVVDKMVWKIKHRAASLHIVGAEASTTCSLGPGLNSAIFSPLFFPSWKSPSRGAKCKKNTFFLSYNAPAFTSKSCESQKISWECARGFWRISKIIEKDSFFCWKCTILTRSLNCVGFEF